jgi:hypothetical protein
MTEKVDVEDHIEAGCRELRIFDESLLYRNPIPVTGIARAFGMRLYSRDGETPTPGSCEQVAPTTSHFEHPTARTKSLHPVEPQVVCDDVVCLKVIVLCEVYGVRQRHRIQIYKIARGPLRRVFLTLPDDLTVIPAAYEAARRVAVRGLNR